ncbi:MAG: hypothetical protein ACXVVQ_20245 [Solirubrobacteraceae bacterium]
MTTLRLRWPRGSATCSWRSAARLLDRDMCTEPASTRTIADELVITQAAVKQHLVNLYDKFAVRSGDSNRRARLANEALRCGAVSLTLLRSPGNQ